MGRIDSRLLGSHIDGERLRLVKVLGSGSSGVVYLAMDRRTGARYAVKSMLKADPESAAFTMQLREIQHHKLVSSHPNILTLHRVIDEGNYVFLILDYCPGGDLFKFISEGRMFAGDDAAVKHIFLQMVDAVEHCHKKGLYHRDIKPENILCSADRSQMFLGDFGLSTMSSQSANFCVGSYSYMSPECLHCDVLSHTYSCQRNDIWALGVILTSMISGRNPWRYATETDGCWKAYLNNPDFLRTMLPISERGNSILRSIFNTTSGGPQISLSELRQKVEELDTFFMSPEEIANSSEQVQIVAASYFRPGSCYLNFQRTSTSYGQVLSPGDGRRLHLPDQWKLDPRLDGDLSEVQIVPREQPTNPINVDGHSSSNSHGACTPPTPVDALIPGERPLCSSYDDVQSSSIFYFSAKNSDGHNFSIKLIRRVIGRYL